MDSIPPIYVSLFHDRTDNNPSQPPAPLPWEQIVKKFSTHVEAESKEKMQLWSPVMYRPGTTRGNNNVELISCAVLDFDHSERSWKSVKADLKSMDLTYIAHSTFSNTPESECFRVIIPLAEPLMASQWPDAWRRIHAVLGGDKATSDISRIYYLPSCPIGDADHWAESSE